MLVVKHGLFVPNFNAFSEAQAFADLAVEAEDAGWDGVYIWDHILMADATPMCDPWIAMAAAVSATQRIRVGPMVTPVPRRHPWKLAREIVTLDRLSGGRVDFGVGIGHPPDTEYETFGHESDARVRADMLDEGLTIITGMWKGHPFSFEGDHYVVQEQTFLPTPMQTPRVPIWVAATWPNKRPFRRAARWDGVFPLKIGDGGFVDMSYDDIAEMLAYVRGHRDASEPFEFIAGHTDAVDRTLEDLAALGVTWMFYNLWDMSAESLAKVRGGPWR